MAVPIWMVFSWDASRSRWLVVDRGAQAYCERLAADRRKQSAVCEIPGAMFVALPQGQEPDASPVPGEPEEAERHKFHGYGEYSFCPVCLAERAEQAADDAHIDYLTGVFSKAVAGALGSLASARDVLADLLSDEVSDEEMWGAGGADALAEVETAARALRNAARIAAVIAAGRRALFTAGAAS